MGTDAPAREPRPRQIVDLPIHEPISTITPFPVHARARSWSASPSSSVSQPGTSAMSGLTCTVKSFMGRPVAHERWKGRRERPEGERRSCRRGAYGFFVDAVALEPVELFGEQV